MPFRTLPRLTEEQECKYHGGKEGECLKTCPETSCIAKFKFVSGYGV
jgi:hypothetical protein